MKFSHYMPLVYIRAKQQSIFCSGTQARPLFIPKSLQQKKKKVGLPQTDSKSRGLDVA